jgi:hypothetical protein
LPHPRITAPKNIENTVFDDTSPAANGKVYAEFKMDNDEFEALWMEPVVKKPEVGGDKNTSVVKVKLRDLSSKSNRTESLETMVGGHKTDMGNLVADRIRKVAFIVALVDALDAMEIEYFEGRMGEGQWVNGKWVDGSYIPGKADGFLSKMIQERNFPNDLDYASVNAFKAELEIAKQKATTKSEALEIEDSELAKLSLSGVYLYKLTSVHGMRTKLFGMHYVMDSGLPMSTVSVQLRRYEDIQRASINLRCKDLSILLSDLLIFANELHGKSCGLDIKSDHPSCSKKAVGFNLTFLAELVHVKAANQIKTSLLQYVTYVIIESNPKENAMSFIDFVLPSLRQASTETFDELAIVDKMLNREEKFLTELTKSMNNNSFDTKMISADFSKRIKVAEKKTGEIKEARKKALSDFMATQEYFCEQITPSDNEIQPADLMTKMLAFTQECVKTVKIAERDKAKGKTGEFGRGYQFSTL